MNQLLRSGIIGTFVFAAMNPGAVLGDETASANWFKSIFSTGEYVAEETYVGEADVERGKHVVRNFDESDTVLRYVATPRITAGVLRLGAEWERFSFGMPERALLPNTLQSAALILG